MATELIWLPRDADVPWLLDRLHRVQAERALLLTPARLPWMQGRLPWRRVARRARDLGLQVAVVTTNPRLARWAREAGLPVFRRREQAEKRPWPQVERWRPGRQVRGREAFRMWKRALQAATVSGPTPRWVVALLAAAWALLFLFLWPQATITLPVQAQEAQVRLPVRLAPAGQNADLGEDVLPLQERCVVVESALEVRATGRVTLPQQAARGRLLFQNLTADPVYLPAGLQVRPAQGPPFVLEEAATLAAGPTGVALVPVRAMQPGAVGNLPAGLTWFLPEPLSGKVLARNPEPMRGGRDQRLPTVTEADVARAVQQGRPDREAQARDLLKTRLARGDLALPYPARVVLVEQQVEPAPGRPAEQARVTLRERWCFWVAAGSTVQALALARLRAGLGPNQQGLPATLQARLEVPKGRADPPMPAMLLARWWTVTIPDASALYRKMALRTPEGVRNLWARQPEAAGPAQVALSPAWWPWVPLPPRQVVVWLPVASAP